MANILRSTLTTVDAENPILAYTDHGDYFWAVYNRTNMIIRKYAFTDYTYSWEASAITGAYLPAIHFDGTYLWAVEYKLGVGANILKIDDSTGEILDSVNLVSYGLVGSAGGSCITDDGTNVWVALPPKRPQEGAGGKWTLHKVDIATVAVTSYTFVYEDVTTSSIVGLEYANTRLWYIPCGSDYSSNGYLYGIDAADPTAQNFRTVSIATPEFLPAQTSVKFVPNKILLDTNYIYVGGYDITSTGPTVYGNFCYFTVEISSYDVIDTIRIIGLASDTYRLVGQDETLKTLFVQNGSVNSYQAMYTVQQVGKQALKGSDMTPDYLQEICPLLSTGDLIHFIKIISSTEFDIVRTNNSLKEALRAEITIVPSGTVQYTTEEQTETDTAPIPLKSSCHDFSFDATADETYTFTVDVDVMPNAKWDITTSPGTKPFISIWDTDENEIAVSETDTLTHAKTLVWIAPFTQTYHVRVRTQE